MCCPQRVTHVLSLCPPRPSPPWRGRTICHCLNKIPPMVFPFFSGKSFRQTVIATRVIEDSKRVIHVHPLLGERAGVRANFFPNFPFHRTARNLSIRRQFLPRGARSGMLAA